jgi:hypothetical protein
MDGIAARDIASVTQRPSDRRRSTRVGVMIMATLRATRGFFDCMVLDVSVGGAKLAMGDQVVLTPGLKVTLIMTPYGALRAQVVWQRLAIAGIQFIDPPEVVTATLGDLVPAEGHPPPL